MTDEEHEVCERLLLNANEEESLSNSAQHDAQEMLHEDLLELFKNPRLGKFNFNLISNLH